MTTACARFRQLWLGLALRAPISPSIAAIAEARRGVAYEV
jgi:hypothetical protein